MLESNSPRNTQLFLPRVWLLLLARLRFLRRPQENFTRERLRRLRHNHPYYMGDIGGLQHLAEALAFVRTQIGVHASRTYHRHTNLMATQFFGCRVREPIESPFRGGIGSTVGQRILAC